MDQNNTTTDSNKVSNKKRITTIIALLSIVILIESIKIYIDHGKLKEQETNLVSSEEDLVSTIQKLHEIQDELNKRIAEVEQLGGDVADLEKAKAEVEADLRNTRKKAGRDVKRLKGKVKGYESLLKLKDKEIEKLKSVNEELYTENRTLKTTQNKLSDSIVQLARNTDNLASKVALASRLKAENITVVALNRRGKKDKSPPFKSKRIEKLQITFDLAENKVAPIEGKKILIRIINQNDQVIFDVANGSGTFIHNGKEEFYTAAQEVLFDNTRQKMSFFYKKTSNYPPGRYRVEAITDGYLMGSTRFDVK